MEWLQCGNVQIGLETLKGTAMSCESLSHQSAVNAATAVLLIRAALKYGVIRAYQVFHTFLYGIYMYMFMYMTTGRGWGVGVGHVYCKQ